MSTSDNLRAIAELMTVPNVLCVSMTEDEKLSIKLRPECSENTLLALSKQCVFLWLICDSADNHYRNIDSLFNAFGMRNHESLRQV